MMQTTRVFPILALSAILVAGCSAGSARDKEEAKETVRTYNRLLAEGYRSLNMTPLLKIASPEQANRVYSHMTALGEARTRMESEPREIGFAKLAFANASTVEASTKELWDFRHVDIDSGRVTLEEKGFPYLLDYRLRERDGKWIVLSVESREIAAPKEGK